MADQIDVPVKATIFRNTENAPFIYFDTAPAYGVMAGAIEVELAARTLIPDFRRDQQLTQEVMSVAHIRCSPRAAELLINSLGKALALLQKLQEQAGGTPPTGAVAGRLN